jgi:fatty-acid desaturase
LRKKTTVTFILFHVLVFLAFVPWLFSWAGVISALVGYYLCVTIGIDLCYHRLLSHRSFKVPRWLEYTFAVFGVCSLQETPTFWVAHHRCHHHHADEELDPHSPSNSFLWGHVGWLVMTPKHPRREVMFEQYAPDMQRDPFYHALESNNLFAWIFLAHAMLFYLVGFTLGWAQTGSLPGGVQLGSSLVVWGVVVRLVYSWHVTWAVNTVCHLWGYRNYDTKDNSRNNWLLSLCTTGSAWHNNHHGDQRSAVHGHYRWWEFDIPYLTLLTLQRLGLAWNIIPRRSPRQHHLMRESEAPRISVPVASGSRKTA